MWFKVFNFVDESIEFGKQNVFSIAGVTATGKTDLALALAEHILMKHVQFNQVDIISADSRQIFADIPIISGADIPSHFEKISGVTNTDIDTSTAFDTQANIGKNAHANIGTNSSDRYTFPYFQTTFNNERADIRQNKVVKKINVHGISMVRATDSWSVAHFQAFAQDIIRTSWQRNGCVIVVGGTGLYHAHLFNKRLSQQPGPIQSVRDSISTVPLQDLQEKVRLQASQKWNRMNNSDKNNPRRLVRVLEQAAQHTASETEIVPELAPFVSEAVESIVDFDVHATFYITADLDTVLKRIKQRVYRRIEQGALQEVKTLLYNYANTKTPQVMSATGVRELVAVVQNKIEIEQAIDKWIQRERKYAKAQLTWWKARLSQVDLVVEA